MDIEQLQSLSDAELNDLAAVKVMGWETSLSWGGSHWIDHIVAMREKIKWKPAEDMNDAIQLLEVMVQDTKYSDATITYPWCVVAGWNPMAEESGWEIKVEDDSLPRAITIAAILTKESQ